MLRLILLFVAGLLVSSIEMNCINPAAADSTVDTLYINSSDTLYRFDTVYSYSRDTVYVETLLVNRSVYIDTAGNNYSKMLAFKGRVGDLPFVVDSVIPAYQIRVRYFAGTGHFDTSAYWYPDQNNFISGGVIDTVNTGSITCGHYILDIGIPIDTDWILTGSSSHRVISSTTSSIWIDYSFRSWRTDDAKPPNNAAQYQFVLISPLE